MYQVVEVIATRRHWLSPIGICFRGAAIGQAFTVRLQQSSTHA